MMMRMNEHEEGYKDDADDEDKDENGDEFENIKR